MKYNRNSLISMYPTKRRTTMNISCIILFLMYLVQPPTASAQGAPVVASAVGILKNLFKIGAGVASQQAIKTATEEAVKKGVPLPTEQYDLRSGLCYYNERTYGIYVWNSWPSRDFTCWVDPWSTVRYKLIVNGGVVSTDPDYFRRTSEVISLFSKSRE